ncbi:hypothetical protein IJI89_03015 [Candidatus Saccharibacteria bacterium]|nr:hypothetical protein [Candidatus Saccharibacteria bacterium]
MEIRWINKKVQRLKLRCKSLSFLVTYASFVFILLSIGVVYPFVNIFKTTDALIDLTGDPSITMTSTKSTASITIDPSLTGVFETTSGNGDIAFTVSTNNYTGYELSVRSINTTLDYNSNSFLPLVSGVTATQFANGGNTTLNNRWGYKPNYYNSETNDKYYGSTTTSTVLDRTSVANTTAKQYTISLGARADASLPMGSYVNDSFTLEAVANVVPSSILTVVYTTGIIGVSIDGHAVADGETVELIRDIPYAIDVTYNSPAYAFSSWSATSGTLGSASSTSTTYTIGYQNATLTANAQPNQYNITIKTATGISKVSLNGVECTSTSGCTVSALTYGSTYNLIATLATGYSFSAWSNSNDKGYIASTSSASTTYTVGNGTTTLTPSATANKYTITLNGNGATTAGSASTTATYNATTLAAITVPQRKYTVSGFTTTNNRASGATVSSTSTLTSTYTFNGWYKESSATNLIASNVSNPVLQASTSYTDSTGHWTSTSVQTLYAGWSSASVKLPTIYKTDYTCGWTTASSGASSIMYTSGGYITPSSNLTLYGVCIPPDMQGLSASKCTTTESEVRDTRDGHIYKVKRMNDGVCWLTQNLELGATDLTVALTSSNSNLASSITAATFNGWKKTSGSSTYTAGEFIQVSGNDAVNGSPYGILYNFYAASGGTITGSANTNDAQYDICPAGWRLPSATRNTGEFVDFATYYSTNTVLQQSVSSGGAGMTLSGTFTSSTPTSKDWLSSYWSSSVADSGCFSRNGKMLGFQFTNSSSTIYTDACNDRGSGHLIRCVLDESKISDLTYLQDFATLSNAGRKGVTNSMTLGTQYRLKDSRDNKDYYIAKLADGNVWMTQNLDLDLSTGTTLTSGNTDITANWTPSSTTRTNSTWTFTTTAPQSYNPGTKYWNGSTHNGSGTSTNYIANSGTAQYHLGNYYNWTAAVAMNNSSSYTTAGVLVNQSICPAGWTLPRGGYGPSTYYALSIQYSGSTWLSPTYLALSGTWGGSYDGVGYSGMFWATGAKSADRAYYADFSSDGSRNVGTGGYDRDMGLPVRCIARPAAAYITQ